MGLAEAAGCLSRVDLRKMSHPGSLLESETAVQSLAQLAKSLVAQPVMVELGLNHPCAIILTNACYAKQ